MTREFSSMENRFLSQSDATGLECVAFSSAEYLDLAEVIVDEATRNWLDATGCFHDPYESSDRWQGGFSGRYVCPAAILVRHRGRLDLLPMLCRVLDRLLGQLQAGRGRPGAGFPAGVYDLIAKEINVAVLELTGIADVEQHRSWCEILAGVVADSAFTGRDKETRGARLTNYEIYASVGEWIRGVLEVSGDFDWGEHFLAASLELFSERGMYRDPGDPMLYDLSVRQNLGELFHYGYNGEHHDALNGCLCRAGLQTLAFQSPLGWAPYGGRSNLFLHNEAMQAYVCEVEAKRWQASGSAGLAAVYRGAACRSLEAIRPFITECNPPHALKNRFEPASKFGRDSGYGEYGVYTLLAASILARTYLVADETIPASGIWLPGKMGQVVSLWPAFHRLCASCGDTQVAMDLKGQGGQDATGIGRIHRVGVPSALGLSLSLAGRAKYITGGAELPRSAALAPAWKSPHGNWVSLADIEAGIENVEVSVRDESPERVGWTVCHWLSGEVAWCRQHFILTSGSLIMEVELPGQVEVCALEVPCLLEDGCTSAVTSVAPGSLEVRFRGARLVVLLPAAEKVVLDETCGASREARYRLGTMCCPGNTFRAQVRLLRPAESR